eukprot:TRINITY_DN1704_c0_g1_i2.p1 TRINITY_DN1704_c0_g1~~TRINITY_DN1704_c0_g1_i2.p1  ORF type:complete len:304 (-),score=84.19 TRINITY_DN1704_c0_g1_i2:39-950(-)
MKRVEVPADEEKRNDENFTSKKRRVVAEGGSQKSYAVSVSEPLKQTFPQDFFFGVKEGEGKGEDAGKAEVKYPEKYFFGVEEPAKAGEEKGSEGGAKATYPETFTFGDAPEAKGGADPAKNTYPAVFTFGSTPEATKASADSAASAVASNTSKTAEADLSQFRYPVNFTFGSPEPSQDSTPKRKLSHEPYPVDYVEKKVPLEKNVYPAVFTFGSPLEVANAPKTSDPSKNEYPPVFTFGTDTVSSAKAADVPQTTKPANPPPATKQADLPPFSFTFGAETAKPATSTSDPSKNTYPSTFTFGQ